ncbi:hypothetical protein FACS1894191_7840 [Clostridia bacterium]|nr:hypothetical protein FACS1894191_7840 [Clostridia bacterium]
MLRYSQTKYDACQPIYYCGYHSSYSAGTACQNVKGGGIDRAIKELILETVNPLTMDAAIAIEREMAERKEEVIRVYRQQMERARYDMDLAKHRYLRVDPDNRLVAAELERDWNQKVSEYESTKMAYAQKSETEVRAIDEKLKSALEQLVSDFPKVWSDPLTSSKEKKRIARLVLEDVTISAESSKIILGVRFKGGATKILEIPKDSWQQTSRDMKAAVVSEIKRLIPLNLTNQEIADALNEGGVKYGFDDKPITANVITYLLHTYDDIPTRRAIAQADGWLTTKSLFRIF